MRAREKEGERDESDKEMRERGRERDESDNEMRARERGRESLGNKRDINNSFRRRIRFQR